MLTSEFSKQENAKINTLNVNFRLENFAREALVRPATLGTRIIFGDRLRMRRSLRKTHIARNNGTKNLVGKVTINLIHDFSRKFIALVKHRENNSFDRQLGFNVLTHHIDRIEEVTA